MNLNIMNVCIINGYTEYHNMCGSACTYAIAEDCQVVKKFHYHEVMGLILLHSNQDFFFTLLASESFKPDD